MSHPGMLKVAAQGDREIVMTRSFNAPRQLVFDARLVQLTISPKTRRLFERYARLA